MASTGIRVGEATRLKLSDVELDVEPALLQIRDSKFGKSRVVPLHPTAAAQLKKYSDGGADTVSDPMRFSYPNAAVMSITVAWFNGSPVRHDSWGCIRPQTDARPHYTACDIILPSSD
jgi:integrase